MPRCSSFRQLLGCEKAVPFRSLEIRPSRTDLSSREAAETYLAASLVILKRNMARYPILEALVRAASSANVPGLALDGRLAGFWAHCQAETVWRVPLQWTRAGRIPRALVGCALHILLLELGCPTSCPSCSSCCDCHG